MPHAHEKDGALNPPRIQFDPTHLLAFSKSHLVQGILYQIVEVELPRSNSNSTASWLGMGRSNKLAQIMSITFAANLLHALLHSEGGLVLSLETGEQRGSPWPPRRSKTASPALVTCHTVAVQYPSLWQVSDLQLFHSPHP
jgi:hypothetical protein